MLDSAVSQSPAQGRAPQSLPLPARGCRGAAASCAQLEATAPCLTLAGLAGCGPAQGQRGVGAAGGDSAQEGAGVQRRAAPAGPGQDVPVQPHGAGQGLPHLPQQLQRGSHGGQAVRGQGAGSQGCPRGVTCRSRSLECHPQPGQLLSSRVLHLTRAAAQEATAVSNTCVLPDLKPQMLHVQCQE